MYQPTAAIHSFLPGSRCMAVLGVLLNMVALLMVTISTAYTSWLTIALSGRTASSTLLRITSGLSQTTLNGCLNWSSGYCASGNPVSVGGTTSAYDWWLQFCSAGTGSGGSLLSESSSVCKALLSIATGSTAVRIIIGVTAFFLALSVLASFITAVRLCSPNAAAAIATRGSAGCCAPSQSGCCGCCGPTSFDSPCTSVGLLSAGKVLVVVTLVAWAATLGVSLGFLNSDPATSGNTTSSLGSSGYGTLGASLVFMVAAVVVQAMLHSRLNWLKGMAMAQNAAAASMAGNNGGSSSVVIMGGHAGTGPAPGAVMAAAYGHGHNAAMAQGYQMAYPGAGAGAGGATVVANPFQAAAAAAAYQQQAQAQAHAQAQAQAHAAYAGSAGYPGAAGAPMSPGGMGHGHAALATPLMAHGHAYGGVGSVDHEDPSDFPDKAKSAGAATAPAATAPPVASAPAGGYYGAAAPAAAPAQYGYYQQPAPGAAGGYYPPAGAPGGY